MWELPESLATNTVTGALVLLLATSAISVLGRFILRIFDGYQAWRADRRAQHDQDRHLREVVIDILIHARFDRRSVTQITDRERINALKAQIDLYPDTYRPFIAFEREDPTFDDYRGIRRKLDTQLMVTCDTFFDVSMLFRSYYEKLASDEFVALDPTRKKGALDQLCVIGADACAEHDALMEAFQRISQDAGPLEPLKSLIADLRAELIGSTPEQAP